MRLLSLARDLRRRKARDRESVFVVEGVRAVEELLRSPVAVVGLLTAPKLADSPRGVALVSAARERKVDVAEVDDREFRSAAETESPQGVLAIARIPDYGLATLASHETLRILVLDGVQDPGNVGTIVRTAAALGADATVALPGTVDLFVRSAMGAHFTHPAFHLSWEELAFFLTATSTALWAADVGGEPLPVKAPARLALAVGNEGSGLSANVRAGAERIVSLAISPSAESLNVAVAAGILLHELRK